MMGVGEGWLSVPDNVAGLAARVDSLQLGTKITSGFILVRISASAFWASRNSMYIPPIVAKSNRSNTPITGGIDGGLWVLTASSSARNSLVGTTFPMVS